MRLSCKLRRNVFRFHVNLKLISCWYCPKQNKNHTYVKKKKSVQVATIALKCAQHKRTIEVNNEMWYSGAHVSRQLYSSIFPQTCIR